MNTIQSTLVHRVAMPEQAGAERHPTLILLHGRGADEEDLMGLSRYLDDRLLLIAVRAPFPFEYGGFTWYDLGEVGAPDTVRFPESRQRLSTFIDDVLSGYPVDPSKLFLLGFSMGTVMSYTMALTRPELFRGVAANSGYVPETAGLQFRWNELSSLSFSIAHGTQDPVIPVEFARRARQLFAQSNAAVQYREYPMGHQISDESLRDVVAWMEPLL